MIGWIAFFVSANLVLVESNYLRRIVRRNAPFYATTNILIVGATHGVVLALLVHFTNSLFLVSDVGRWVMYALGFLGSGYLGFSPDEIDYDHRTRKTASIASFSYLTAVGVLWVVNG
jgi:hypothetical protein